MNLTPREIKIAKKILDYLHELDGGQAHDQTIHAEIGGLPTCGRVEFEGVLAVLDTHKYAVSVKTKFKGILWNISDAGEAARLAM